MKNCFKRNAFKCLMLMSCFIISSALFAITFNEPRKVIIPKYANVVYRDLTILDKIYFDIENDSSRVFLLELGKRPSFFWNRDKNFYFYQNLLLKFDPGTITYNGFSGNDNVLAISDIILDEGVFASEHTFLNETSNITINNSSSTLLVNYKGNFPVNLYFGNEASIYKIYSSNTSYSKGSSTSAIDISHKINHLYLRDVNFNGVKFPSNRAMIHYSGGKYKAQGTATEFRLSSPKPLNNNDSAKSYYAPWQLYNNGVLTTNADTAKPCGTVTGLDKRCAKQKCSLFASAITCVDIDRDTVDDEFECVNKKYSFGGSAGTYDKDYTDGYCYDYQEKFLMDTKAFNDSTSLHDYTVLYNNNKAYYDFKVEEIYSINENGTATLISQSPKTMTNGFYSLSSYNSTTDSWTFKTTTRNFFLDGTNYNEVFPRILTDSNDDHPCFTICNGKLCSSNYVYLRDMSRRDLKGGENSSDNYWPSSDGHKQHLVMLTYTLGFCPQNNSSSDNSYGDYEDNLGERLNLIDALLIKKSNSITTVEPNATGTWDYSKVCVRRKVYCNSMEDNPELKYNRSYTLLSTDN